MNSLFSYEAFLLKVRTKDNYNVIVGGFCPFGKKEDAINSYLNLSNYRLGQTTDEYLIDYLLADAIKQVSPKWICIVGASISIDQVMNSTGGIIGNPFDEVESAHEDIEEITKGIYLVSFPGGPGASFSGIYSDAVMLKERIIEYKSGKSSLQNIIYVLDKISKLYILVEDGSGLKSNGGIYISDCSGKRFETFDKN